jgi:uncharacterized membrane protein YqgA involved in biofilm formation
VAAGISKLRAASSLWPDQIKRTAPTRQLIFRLALWPRPALSQRVNGAFLNAMGILIGGLFGLALRQSLSLRAQIFFRSALGAFTVFFGLRLVWLSVSGTFLSASKQVFIAALAVTLGFWIGKLLHLQKLSNRLGHYAGSLIASAQSDAPRKTGGGFIACTILFCAAPLGLLGAVTDGLPTPGGQSGYFWLLAIKAVMDGLAMTGFVKVFGWPSAMSAFPVFAFLGGITFACQFYAQPFLAAHGLVDSVNAAAGFIACAIALMIFEVRRVELANFLPALAVAPLLAWWLK